MKDGENISQLLIVDDSPNWRDLLITIFDDHLNVTAVSSYNEAKKILIENFPPFEVAIIDLRLDDTDPDNEDGLRLLRFIQKNQIRTNPIILTGYPTVSSAKIAFRDMGAFEYIEKYSRGGLDINVLRKIVHDALGEKRVLVVEDDAEWQGMLSDILAKEGYQVDRVNSSQKARSLIRKNKYPISIVDLKLGSETPDKGIDLLEYANRITPKSKVVVVSGYGSAERVRDAFERGSASAFIFKGNFDPENFRQKIRSVTRLCRKA